MITWIDLSGDQVAALDRRLPVIIPLGLIEAHGPHLPLSVDCATAEYFSRRIAAGSGAILAPLLNYGFADEMREYPGTIGLRPDTLTAVATDIILHFAFHGFIRQVWLSGHGANLMPVEIAFHRAWEKNPHLRLAYWNWWSQAGLAGVHHADKAETELAIACGVQADMSRARDFSVSKPWYRIRSRQAIDPESGGINGVPTQADPQAGVRARDEVVRILTGQMQTIIREESAS